MEIIICTPNTSLYHFIKNTIEHALYYRLGTLFSLHPAHPRTPAELVPLFRTSTSYLVFLDTGNNAGPPNFLSALHSKLSNTAFFLFSENAHCLHAALQQQLRVVGFCRPASESAAGLKKKLADFLTFLSAGLQNAAQGIFLPTPEGGLVRAAYANIYAIELEKKRSHYCTVHCTSGSFPLRSSIKALLQTLDYRFCPCSASCIVNLQYVKEIDLPQRRLLLTDGRYYYFTTARKPLFKQISGNLMPLRLSGHAFFFPQ